MISFTAYLQNNNDRAATRKDIQSVYKKQIQTPDNDSDVDNDMAIGDVWGGEGTVSTTPGEPNMLRTLFHHAQAEDEEPTLEVNDSTEDEDGMGNEDDTELELDNNADVTNTDQVGTTPDSENPDKQGMIRKIPNAHLIYKRTNDSGTFAELWMYEIKKGMRDEFDVRDNILAGTDIPPNGTSSPDGSQTYNMWTAGNMQLIQINGLPN
jgi:hypothetical protein